MKYKKTILIILTIVFAITLQSSNSSKEYNYQSNPDLAFVKDNWKGNLTENGRFVNDKSEKRASMWTALKWKFSRNPQRKEKKNENYNIPVSPLTAMPKEDGIIWLGHSTFLIRINGISLITDPIFYNVPTCKRKTELPCDPEILTGIDYMLISHDHFDHFNIKSIELLHKNNPEMKALIPLGGERLFKKKKHLKDIPRQEAGWWQEFKLNEDIRIIFLPAKHWGRRSINDTNKTLWGGFMIINGDKKVYYAGDTAYGNMFTDIHEVFGDIDICLMPIGAYSPSYMMSHSHVNPEEAVKAFMELGGKTFIPMHYGTFDLADEPMGEPIRKLKETAIEQNISDKINELRLGEVFPIKNIQNTNK